MKKLYFLLFTLLCLSTVTMKATTHLIHNDGKILDDNNAVLSTTESGFEYAWSEGASSTCTLSVKAIATAEVTCNGDADGQAIATITGGVAPFTYSWSNHTTANPTAANLAVGAYTVTVTDAGGCVATSALSISQPTAIAVTIVRTVDVLCNGGTTGSLTADPATGGTSPYTYIWTPSGGSGITASSLAAGIYTLTATDAHGCTGHASSTITQPTALSVGIASSTNVLCNGSATGTATASAATGGTAPYTYAWTPSGGATISAKNLIADTYTVKTKDAHGCTATASVALTQPSAVAVSIRTHTNVTCSATTTGSITANAATGGTAPYTYKWTVTGGTSLTASSLTTGTYTITAKDANGCTAEATQAITEPTTLDVAISAHVNDLCNGASTGSATAHAATGGTAPYTYAWTPSGGATLTASALTAGTYTVTARDANGCTASANVAITQPTALVVSVSKSTNVLCHGEANGTATGSNPTGGTAPYTYDWTPSGGSGLTASGLTNGTYTLTVRDKNGCITAANIAITQPTALAMAPSITTEVSCYGGSNGTATATAPTGGTAPYTYAWAPKGGASLTATALAANTYTITAKDAHGCTITSTGVVTQPAALAVAISSSTDVLCHGGTTGTATASAATGGTSPYTYAWTPSGGTSLIASALSAGTYTITARDAHGCTAEISKIITQPTSALTETITSHTDVLCHGGATGTATASAATGGTAPYSYAWTPSGGTSTSHAATGLSIGSYTITATDANGCHTTASTTITQPTKALKDSVASLTYSGTTGTVVIGATGGTVPYTYTWNPLVSSTNYATGIAAGSYTVTIKDANECTSSVTTDVTPPPILVEGIAGVTSGSNDVTLYPNPNNGAFTMNGLREGQTLQVYDFTGRMIKSEVIDNSTMQLSISNEPYGIYLIRVIDKDGSVVSLQKMIKE